MPAIVFALRYIAVIVVQLVAFFFFYNHPHGRRAVYRTWYAWIIDVLAIMSGIIIMGLSVYALHNPWIFNITVPDAAFWTTFVVGGWQASIHAVKWVIRSKR